jgi:phosphatidyl-N-methylethanolamine N-methyltransferase
MNLEVFTWAAVFLSLERICYVWIWRAPEAFRSVCTSPWIPDDVEEPVEALRLLFYAFKSVQVAVFIWWCYVHGHGSLWPPDGGTFALVLGAGLMAFGQVLNASVFYRLGKVGVFYGNRFGYEVPWCERFPYSFCSHPQYVGAVLSIWGFFLIMRFPHADWYVLPALETIYYSLGARFEQ